MSTITANGQLQMETIPEQENSKRIDPAKWLDQYGDTLYAFALMRVRDQRQAEDLVQETLLVAFESMDKFRGDSSERTWLIGILKHKILDYFRQSRREQPITDEDIARLEKQALFDDNEKWKHVPGKWDIPEQFLENEQFWNTIHHCVEKLPDKLRTMFIMRELDGFETDTVISALNISSKNNLWVMLSRARLHLRDCMESNWFKEDLS